MSSVRFVFFKGISLLSRLIRFWTRSSISHVAYKAGDSELIEAWKFHDGVRWGVSDFSNHTPGTPWEEWEVDVTDEMARRIDEGFRRLAGKKVPWDLSGVVGFVFKCGDDPGSFFCSEGCVQVLQDAGVLPKGLEAWRFSPVLFREVLKVVGARKVAEGVVGD